MSIQLKPEFLGKVALEIAMDATGLHVKISAEDNGVRSMINGQINSLIESLANKGIEVVEVEVAYTGVDNGAFKESRGGQAQSNHQRRSYRQIETADGATVYSALPFDMLDYYLDADISSVEYRA
jgi:flagellar hook-length control protein FliK